MCDHVARLEISTKKSGTLSFTMWDSQGRDDNDKDRLKRS